MISKKGVLIQSHVSSTILTKPLDFLFSGTTTDLVPQLLGMFDELARRRDGYSGEHAVLTSSCGIPAALQKRLSLVPAAHRGSIFGQLCTNGDLAKSVHQEEPGNDGKEEPTNGTDNNTMLETVVSESVASLKDERNGESTEKQQSYRRESNSLTPLRYYPTPICSL